jgi:hypothetical protein
VTVTEAKLTTLVATNVRFTSLQRGLLFDSLLLNYKTQLRLGLSYWHCAYKPFSMFYIQLLSHIISEEAFVTAFKAWRTSGVMKKFFILRFHTLNKTTEKLTATYMGLRGFF